MNRPPLNVLHNPMMETFNAILADLLTGDELSAVVIDARGKTFSAGVDVADHTPEKVRDMIDVRLTEHGLEGITTGREKHISSIYRKMSEQRKPFADIMDVFASKRVYFGCVTVRQLLSRR